MTRRTTARLVALVTMTALLLLSVPGAAEARSKSKWVKNTGTSWLNGGGGDNYRTGYAPDEKRPKFAKCDGGDDCISTGDDDGPWLEWVTKVSDLPSGAWLQAGIVVHDGKVFVSGGATNSFLALDTDTGLPVWRFQPDPRTDGYAAAYPASNAPAVDPDRNLVYFTFSNGWLYALDIDSGEKKWSFQAKKGYTDSSDRTDPDNAAEEDDSPYREESWVDNRDEFGPVHPGVDYPKIHGATAFCEGNVFFMTLSGYVYAIDADTGKPAKGWDTNPVYADGQVFPGELVWPEFKVGGVQREDSAAAGMSTRRFEAVPGVGCLHGEVQVAGADGHLRFLDPATGEDKTQGGDVGAEMTRIITFDNPDPEPDTTVNFCQVAGWNCDIAVGLADPESGDYVVTTLDGRSIRLHWQSHDSEWTRTYNAPLPFSAGGDLPLSLAHHEDGFIAQAVTGGPLALDPRESRRLLYFMNQDGHLYILGLPDEGKDDDEQPASCPNAYTNLREDPVDAAEEDRVPCLVARMGISPNTDEQTRHTRRDIGGPWDFNQHALSGLVLGGNVVYLSTWDYEVDGDDIVGGRIFGVDVQDPADPEIVWQHDIKWDTKFKYPPFGDTFDRPFADIDLKMFAAPALVGGALYLSANDGTVMKFNLHEESTTRKNLVILGSGAVPFLPEWEQDLGDFDHVWTPADWYKNQVPPKGYRFPKPAGVATASTLLFGSAAMWWYVRRREDLLEHIEGTATE